MSEQRELRQYITSASEFFAIKIYASLTHDIQSR